MALWGALLAGLEATLNPLLAATLLPAVLACGMIALRRSGWRGGVCAVASFVAPFAVLVYLPLRGARSIVAWGSPDTWEGFVRVVTASQYSEGFMSEAVSPLGERAADNFGAFLGACGPVFLALLADKTPTAEESRHTLAP